jgi:hypothetical protein
MNCAIVASEKDDAFTRICFSVSEIDISPASLGAVSNVGDNVLAFDS